MWIYSSNTINRATLNYLHSSRLCCFRQLLTQPAFRQVWLRVPNRANWGNRFWRKFSTTLLRSSKIGFKFEMGGSGKKGGIGKIIAAWTITTFIYLLMRGLGDTIEPKEITWAYFVDELLSKGEVADVQIAMSSSDTSDKPYGKANVKIRLHRGAVVEGVPADPTQIYSIPTVHGNTFEDKLRQVEKALGIDPSKQVPVRYRRVGLADFLIPLSFVTLVIYLGYRSLRTGNQSGKSKSMKKSILEGPMAGLRSAPFKFVDSSTGGKTPNVFFKDVAGLHEAKVEIKEFVDYLKRPGSYAQLGAKLPKGSLMLGPPGCGKTLLAKAVATESGVPFFAVNGSEFVEMIGGLGASRVRELFKKAKQHTPCIIYIDEIDAIGRKRSESNSPLAGTDSESEQTLNQLLTEMDGMSTAKSVIVLASTNRSDTLDKALLRPGRFDRHIMIDLPTRAERVELFDLYLKKIKLSEEAVSYAVRLADLTPGFSGADVANLCNEAAIIAATAGKEVVSAVHLNAAMERVMAGAEKRSSSLSPEERKVVAYHESGHALVGWLLEYTDALLKVSIVPRTSAALGFAQYNPADRKLYSKEELLDRICMALGGRAAENVVFGRITTGAQDDLKKVTKIAYDQVQVYGMNENVGPLSFGRMDGQEFQKKPFSKKLQALIDNEAHILVAECYHRTEDLIRKNLDKLNKIAEQLNEKEVLSYEDVKRLIGPPSFGEKKKVSAIADILPTPVADTS